MYELEESEWMQPIMVAKKKNVKLRICIHFIRLNQVTIKDFFPIPFVEDILEVVARKEIYSFLDVYSSYNHVFIKEKDQYLTTFATKWGDFS
jgi:hypothetical protein